MLTERNKYEIGATGLFSYLVIMPAATSCVADTKFVAKKLMTVCLLAPCDAFCANFVKAMRQLLK